MACPEGNGTVALVLAALIMPRHTPILHLASHLPVPMPPVALPAPCPPPSLPAARPCWTTCGTSLST